jgi:hypothetical protein
MLTGIQLYRAFFLGGRRGTRTPKHFVNLTGESKNFKMLDFALHKLQILSSTAFIFSDLNYKVVIFLSQTESNPKHYFRKKSTAATSIAYLLLMLLSHTHRVLKIPPPSKTTNTVRSERRCALINGVGSDVHEHLFDMN